MKKRLLSAILWFFTGWYAGALLAHVLTLSTALAPILGLAAAALIAGDPLGIIWPRSPVADLEPNPA